MATGPEHYREAERLLDIAGQAESTETALGWQRDAQVHATLALAAASAMSVDKTGTTDVWDEWNAALRGEEV